MRALRVIRSNTQHCVGMNKVLMHVARVGALALCWMWYALMPAAGQVCGCDAVWGAGMKCVSTYLREHRVG